MEDGLPLMRPQPNMTHSLITSWLASNGFNKSSDITPKSVGQLTLSVFLLDMPDLQEMLDLTWWFIPKSTAMKRNRWERTRQEPKFGDLMKRTSEWEKISSVLQWTNKRTEVLELTAGHKVSMLIRTTYKMCQWYWRRIKKDTNSTSLLSLSIKMSRNTLQRREPTMSCAHSDATWLT